MPFYGEIQLPDEPTYFKDGLVQQELVYVSSHNARPNIVGFSEI